jgi:hypothetical protein
MQREREGSHEEQRHLACRERRDREDDIDGDE